MNNNAIETTGTTAARGEARCEADGAVVTASVEVYGPQVGGQSPCTIVRPGEDPEPTCVNPQCPRLGNCHRHVTNRTDPRTPSIAIITHRDCTWYDPIEPDNKDKETEQ